MVRIGVPRETEPGEHRVALTPLAVPALARAGAAVMVEQGAGSAAGFPDDAFASKGASLGDRAEVLQAEVILQVRATALAHADEDLARLGPGQTLIGLCDPLWIPDVAAEIAARGINLFALELLPRITRAQAMDVLSSQATVAGYKAVLLAADRLPKLFPLMTTAAGTIAPARVLVVGAGVAGLQAIATARRLGAVVEAYDVRPAAREQVESLGARFVELPLQPGDAEDASGYAKELGSQFYVRQRELLTKVVSASDVVITAAQIPGVRAPMLVTADMVGSMAAGSVVVDLAAAQGGNCEVTRPDQEFSIDGVTVLGPTNAASLVAHDASQMYGRNISTFVLHLLREGEVAIDEEDEITKATLVARGGAVVHRKVLELLRPPSELRDEPALASEGTGA